MLRTKPFSRRSRLASRRWASCRRNACKFRAALGEALALAREANVYLDRKAPWFQIKEDKAAAATTVYVILRAVDNLKTILASILPHTAQKLHEYLGYEGQLFGIQQVVEYEEETRSHRALTYDHSGAVGTWAASELPPGQALRAPAPLFKKLDESVGRGGVRAAGGLIGEQGNRKSESRGIRSGSFDYRWTL
jgi:methionyl-tRNA synthetase